MNSTGQAGQAGQAPVKSATLNFFEIFNGAGRFARIDTDLQIIFTRLRFQLRPGRPVRVSMYLALVYNLLERHEEAVAELEPYLDEYPSYFPLQRALAYAYCQTGDMQRARQVAAHVMQSEPGYSSEAFGRKMPFTDAKIRNQFIDTLKKARFY